MTLEIIVSREARADIAEAATEYYGISPTLAERFSAELERVYSDIAEYPEMFPIVYKNFRRGLLRKFPYSVFYVGRPSRPDGRRHAACPLARTGRCKCVLL